MEDHWILIILDINHWHKSQSTKLIGWGVTWIEGQHLTYPFDPLPLLQNEYNLRIII
jgi:hypothetical protein